MLLDFTILKLESVRAVIIGNYGENNHDQTTQPYPYLLWK